MGRPTSLLLVLLLGCQVLASLEAVKQQEIEDILKNEVVLEQRNLDHGTKLRSRHLDELEELISKLLKRDESSEPDYTSEEAAKKWLGKLQIDMRAKYRKVVLAQWAYLTNLTEENGQKFTQASTESDKWMKPQIDTGRKFLKNKDSFTNSTIIRMLNKLVYGQLIPISSDNQILEKINSLQAQMESIYSKGTVPAKENGKPLLLDPDLGEIMTFSRDYDTLEYVWKGWRDAVGPALKPKFAELVGNMNTAAREYGMPDVGMAWRLTDFEDDNIGETAAKLWVKVKPLYEELHAYVRRKLMEKYPNRGIEENGPIPAHLLGNMWAQEWTDIFDIVMPYPDAPTPDFTAALKAKYDAKGLFKLAEGFFTSIGLDYMTDIFWEKSMIVKPPNRDVVCHASADSMMADEDFRIKMCTSINKEDFETVHHEMGHVEYYMQYEKQPMLFQEGANAAFHEAVGDTIALSAMTPAHLKAIGLIDKDEVDDDSDDISESDINYLMQQALKKVAFLPFGYLMDLWRWDVFSGKTTPEEYNKHWWHLRLKYQGLKPPVERTENDFDPGAKYHIASNVPYLRYFGSFMAQFQFQQAMCDAKNHTGPLFKCDVYQSKEAGELLKSMLSLGCSKPWPEAMQEMTGQKDFRPDAILKYFDPLLKWLKKENKKHKNKAGWKG